MFKVDGDPALAVNDPVMLVVIPTSVVPPPPPLGQSAGPPQSRGP